MTGRQLRRLSHICLAIALFALGPACLLSGLVIFAFDSPAGIIILWSPLAFAFSGIGFSFLALNSHD